MIEPMVTNDERRAFAARLMIDSHAGIEVLATPKQNAMAL